MSLFVCLSSQHVWVYVWSALLFTGHGVLLQGKKKKLYKKYRLLSVRLNVILGAWRDCACLKQFPPWLFFHGIILCPDYNALLFSACMCVCLCVCACAGTMALCPMETGAAVKAVLHFTRDRRQTGWNPVQFTSPALHRQPRWKKKKAHAHTKCTCTYSIIGSTQLH